MKDPRTKARNYVSFLLARRSYTKKEITDKLLRKKYEPELAEGVVREFETEGWLNDKRFARAFASDSRTFNKLGKRLVRMKLSRKGIENEVIENALEKVYEGVDETEMAFELAAKRSRSLKKLDKKAAARRLQGYLARKGYGLDVILKTVKKVLSDVEYQD